MHYKYDNNLLKQLFYTNIGRRLIEKLTTSPRNNCLRYEKTYIMD